MFQKREHAFLNMWVLFPPGVFHVPQISSEIWPPWKFFFILLLFGAISSDAHGFKLFVGKTRVYWGKLQRRFTCTLLLKIPRPFWGFYLNFTSLEYSLWMPSVLSYLWGGTCGSAASFKDVVEDIFCSLLARTFGYWEMKFQSQEFVTRVRARAEAVVVLHSTRKHVRSNSFYTTHLTRFGSQQGASRTQILRIM